MHLERVFVCFQQNCFQCVCPLKMENTEFPCRSKISEGNWRFFFVAGRSICVPWSFMFHYLTKLFKMQFIIIQVIHSMYTYALLYSMVFLGLVHKWGLVVPIG